MKKPTDKEYGRAIGITRISCGIPSNGITGLDSDAVMRIEQGALYPTTTALTYYAESLNLDFEDFLIKIDTTIKALRAMESI